jgi:CheY-like chemotaxis protein
VLARLPVIVCSGSNQDSDVETAYALGANGYIIKPGRPSRLTQIVGTIKKYWLDADGPPPDCQEWLSVIVPPPSSERREQ